MKIATVALATAILVVYSSSFSTAQTSLGGTAAGGSSAVGGQGGKGKPIASGGFRMRHHHKRAK